MIRVKGSVGVIWLNERLSNTLCLWTSSVLTKKSTRVFVCVCVHVFCKLSRSSDASASFSFVLFICWGCWFQVQPFSISAHLFLSIYTTNQARAHVFCGPPHHKLLSLIMRRSGVLQRATTIASSRDWEWDTLDGEASRVMTVQLAPDLHRPNDWPRSSWTDRSPAWISLCSSHPGPQTDPLMGHQTKLPVRLARSEAMNA